ncbi:2-dehydropantoate 2-reductase [Cyclobacterium lianum]|uniref:2-dehydropantoate 2-reductase n=1 Tax=Cyclobacterium lianum TaxID=388280 RepID=A0A1M7LH32_9BACT|nr:2-dehydropantoate 2-reductase [Cyclobacterium lianum]SHM77469.1 2-dehydropantoate 2-reductase [Cyclobacterium lianum]
MKKEKTIAILGIGGVGGFIGAKLLLHRGDVDFRLIFIARGNSYERIHSNGLHFSSNTFDGHLFPDSLQLSGAAKGPYDLVLVATKSPSLKAAIAENSALFSEKTLVIPLQNMVDASSQIKPLVNGAEVLDSCIYLISNVQEPGHVKHLGGPGKIVCGIPESDNHQWVFEALRSAQIPVIQTSNPEDYLWRKFLFISSLAALTAAYEVNFGQIRADPKLMQIWSNLMEELAELARSQEIELSEADIEDARSLMGQFPEDARSSFQLDVASGHFGEKRTLIDEVIEKSLYRGLNPETFELMEGLISQNIRKAAGL